MTDETKSRDLVDAAVAAAIGQRRSIIPDPDTAAGRQEMLRRMRIAKHVHWQLAIGTGCHGYIETNGPIGIYLGACERLEAAGARWVDANIHGIPITLLEHEQEYMEEKLGCIFGRKVRIEFL